MKAKHKEINYKSIAGMRNLLVHEYFDIDLNLVWNTVKWDLSLLKKDIKGMLKELK